MKIPIFEHEAIKPLKNFGITHKFWDLHIDTLIYTWISMAALLAIIIATRFYLKRKKINPFSYTIEQIVDFFVNLCKDSFGFFKYRWFAFISSLFVFALVCNASGMLPFIEEPTKDINTALACGISSFLYVQFQKIKISGIWEYAKEYIYTIPIPAPTSIIRMLITPVLLVLNLLLIPLNLIGELAKIASMSFRLFGNILGGAIIVMIVLKSIEPFRVHFMIYVAIALPILWLFAKRVDVKKYPYINYFMSLNNLIIFSGAWLLMFFGIFEGLVQAFVITMLTITYLSLVIKNDDDESETEAKEIKLKEA